MTEFSLRQAEAEDVTALVEIEAASWPPQLAATAEQIAARIATYREGQWVAVREGQPVGVCFAQRVRADFFFAGPRQWDRLTDAGRFRASHDPSGNVYQLVAVGVGPRGRGLRIGRQLVDRQLQFARSLPDVQRILGVTRPAGFSEVADSIAIEDYIRARTADGRWRDPTLDFHLGSGARLVSLVADYRTADRASGGFGVLIEYPRRTISATVAAGGGTLDEPQ